MKIKILLAAVLSLAAGALAEETGPTLRIDHPMVVGSLTKDDIRQTVHLHEAEVRQCYDAGRKLKPGIGGEVTASFVIDVTGAVSHVRITQSTLKNANVENCMINHLTHWHFPRPNHGEVKVTYPWRLTANS
jgi:hypothetical protein